ncbi:hypothetical protein QTN25_002643 [Entamoeba marina]
MNSVPEKVAIGASLFPINTILSFLINILIDLISVLQEFTEQIDRFEESDIGISFGSFKGMFRNLKQFSYVYMFMIALGFVFGSMITGSLLYVLFTGIWLTALTHFFQLFGKQQTFSTVVKRGIVISMSCLLVSNGLGISGLVCVISTTLLCLISSHAFITKPIPSIQTIKRRHQMLLDEIKEVVRQVPPSQLTLERIKIQEQRFLINKEIKQKVPEIQRVEKKIQKKDIEEIKPKDKRKTKRIDQQTKENEIPIEKSTTISRKEKKKNQKFQRERIF